MTEEESKTKWCPMYKVTISDTSNRYFSDDGKFSSACIASDCMWWVWDFEKDAECNGSGHCGAIK